MERTLCPYCRREAGHMKRHMAACPKRPDIARRLRAFMCEWTGRGGYAMSSETYADMRMEFAPTLPNHEALFLAFGSWKAFVAWCGLPHRGAAHDWEPNPETMPGSQMADDTMYHDPSCLRCLPVVRPVRCWEWRSRTWAVVGAQTAWMVR